VRPAVVTTSTLVWGVMTSSYPSVVELALVHGHGYDLANVLLARNTGPAATVGWVPGSVAAH
jgi:hypothetical protein